MRIVIIKEEYSMARQGKIKPSSLDKTTLAPDYPVPMNTLILNISSQTYFWWPVSMGCQKVYC